MPIFAISADELTKFDATGLEGLVGRLCEAELEQQHKSRALVHWSGSLNAPDGGVDVMVKAEGGSFNPGYIPNRWTVFQCKVPTMPPSTITQEMQQDGQPLEILQRLAKKSGAYIIVGLNDDPGQPQLNSRLKAMNSVVRDMPDGDQLELNFYGKTQLARWLDCHPAVQVWVRQQLGLALTGWQPFGRWARTPEADTDEFIEGEGLKITIGQDPGESSDNESLVAGLNRLRGHLTSTRQAVRIAGLSGIGKTRLVQALFDDQIGENSLNPNSAIYADIGAEIIPSARDLLTRLIEGGYQAVVVVDNCAPAMHRDLAAIHKSRNSHNVTLITIEYDVREDSPEHTDVVRLETTGTEICTRLIQRRFPNLSETEAGRLAELADGNARLGLAIAEAVGEGENVSSLNDNQLFQRLFRQRNEADPADLEASAEVLSLVYSFSTVVPQKGVDELSILAGLIGQDRATLYRHSGILLDRQIIQKRSTWRAVLPHVIANRLAKQALKRIDPQHLKQSFGADTSGRLIKSFARRVGYLHDSTEARNIVDRLLTHGLPGNLHPVIGPGLEIVELLAPANQEAVLRLFQHYADGADRDWFLSRYQNANYSTICRLLGNFAYEERYFSQSIRLLVEFAKREKPDERYDNILHRLENFFQLQLSGTHAGTSVRAAIVRGLLESQDPADRTIGFLLLKTALKNSQFANTTPEFGSHVRDLGFRPKFWGDIFGWYEAFLAIASDILQEGDVEAQLSVARIIESRISELWGLTNLQPSLAALIERLIEMELVADLLSSLNRTYSHTYHNAGRGNGKLGEEGKEALEELIAKCQPQTLASEVRTFILSRRFFEQEESRSFDTETGAGSFEEVNKAAEQRAIGLGRRAAGELESLDELWLEFFQRDGTHRFQFGVGLSAAVPSQEDLIGLLFDKIDQLGEDVLETSIVAGVLSQIHRSNPDKLEPILEDAFSRPVCRDWMVGWLIKLPGYQPSYNWLMKLVDQRIKYTHWHDCFIWRPELGLTDSQKRSFINKLLDTDGGDLIAIEGLAHCLRDDTYHEFISSEVTRALVCRAVISAIRTAKFNSSSSMNSHYIERLIDDILSVDRKPEEATAVIDALFGRMRDDCRVRFELRKLARLLAKTYPESFLNHLQDALTNQQDDESDSQLDQIRIDIRNGDILRLVAPDDLRAWIRQGEVQTRCEFLAEFIQPLPTDNHGELKLRENSIVLVEMSGNAEPVISHYRHALMSTGWSGNLSARIQQRRKAFEVLEDHQRVDVRQAAAKLIERAKQMEEHERQNEQEEERGKQRFE